MFCAKKWKKSTWIAKNCTFSRIFDGFPELRYSIPKMATENLKIEASWERDWNCCCLPPIRQARLPFPRERRSSSASVRPGLASLENKRSQSRLSGLFAISRTRGSRCGGFRAPLRRTPQTKIGESRAQSGGPLCCACSPPYGSRLKSSFFSPPLLLGSATDIKIRRYHRSLQISCCAKYILKL